VEFGSGNLKLISSFKNFFFGKVSWENILRCLDRVDWWLELCTTNTIMTSTSRTTITQIGISYQTKERASWRSKWQLEEKKHQLIEHPKCSKIFQISSSAAWSPSHFKKDLTFHFYSRYRMKFFDLQEPDAITMHWIQESKTKSSQLWLQIWHIVAKLFLKIFLTQTCCNGLLKRGSMFILSENVSNAE
jgi:DREV methyltransferase